MGAVSGEPLDTLQFQDERPLDFFGFPLAAGHPADVRGVDPQLLGNSGVNAEVKAMPFEHRIGFMVFLAARAVPEQRTGTGIDVLGFTLQQVFHGMSSAKTSAFLRDLPPQTSRCN